MPPPLTSGAGTVNWALEDQDGSVTDVINNSGTVLDHIIYDSFGNIASQTNSSAAIRFGYAGMQTDSATGLYYDNARYYNPETGTFTTPDPIGSLGSGSNLYRYVGNDPADATDPSGLSPQSADCPPGESSNDSDDSFDSSDVSDSDDGDDNSGSDIQSENQAGLNAFGENGTNSLNDSVLGWGNSLGGYQYGGIAGSSDGVYRGGSSGIVPTDGLVFHPGKGGFQQELLGSLSSANLSKVYVPGKGFRVVKIGQGTKHPRFIYWPTGESVAPGTPVIWGGDGFYATPTIDGSAPLPDYDFSDVIGTVKGAINEIATDVTNFETNLIAGIAEVLTSGKTNGPTGAWGLAGRLVGRIIGGAIAAQEVVDGTLGAAASLGLAAETGISLGALAPSVAIAIHGLYAIGNLTKSIDYHPLTGSSDGGGDSPGGDQEPQQAGGDEGSQPQQDQGNGSYTNTHKSGKTYDGKGGTDRMNRSANNIAKKYKDPVVSKTPKSAANEEQSFIDEQNSMEANGGPGGNTYNKINSPGKKLRDGK